MSILKMKFVSIVGLKDYFDDFVQHYLIDSGIQLENSLSFLENIKGLSPYANESPYQDMVTRSSALIHCMHLDKEIEPSAGHGRNGFSSADSIRSEISALEQALGGYTGRMEKIRDLLNKYTHMKLQLELLTDLDVDLESFFSFEFIKFRFGRIPKKTYKQLQLYLDDLQAIVTPVSQDEDSMWLIYFTPRKYSEKVDGIFSSLYFERVRISGELKGTPAQALGQIRKEMAELQQEQKRLEEALRYFIAENKDKAKGLLHASIRLNRITEVRKYASHTAESFYITGWIPEEELKVLLPHLDRDQKILFIQEEPGMLKTLQPPTELRNSRIFRPFEAIVRMYGLPSYNEIDPTFFVGITYFIMFGLMFGDIGQGFVLLAGGLGLLKLKVALGGVIFGAGMSSMLFGTLYGSIFGFEHYIPALWIRPMDNINTMLVTGIAVGIVFITAAMILNIINGIKSSNLIRVLLDRNGIAGFVFYWTAVTMALFLLQGWKPLLPASFAGILLAVSILAMFVKEPVENRLHRKKAASHSQGMFFVQTFFELFDMVLSFISNTISFIRLSAFALNHAGLFMAVLILSEMTGGFGGVLEIIIGNIVIIGLEGLIVGIQALRLEYYELFSRFFTGNGRPYRPLKNQQFS